MIFFTDECVPAKFAELLEVFDRRHEIRAHKDYFEQGTPDRRWIEELGTWSPKPAILAGDGRILQRSAELAALQEADLTFVLLEKGWTKLPWHDQAWKIIKAWPAVVQNVEKARKPSVFSVSVGSLKVQRRGFLADLGR